VDTTERGDRGEREGDFTDNFNVNLLVVGVLTHLSSTTSNQNITNKVKKESRRRHMG